MSKFKIQTLSEKLRARKRTRATLIVVLVLLLPFLIAGSWFWLQINPITGAGEKVEFVIERGSGTSAIGEILEKNGVVNSGTAFAYYSKLARRGPYQAGTYELNKNLGARDAATVLEKGPIVNYDSFTIIPGQRLIDVKTNVAKLPNLSEQGFQTGLDSGAFRSKFQPEQVTTLEGLLLPETYSISTSETESDIIRRSLQEFDARATANGLAGDYNGYSAYEIIVIASMIEKEARFEGDRKLIASVIYNRLSKDMLLQIDATVLYGLGKSGGSLSLADLKVDGPYNTYINKGLVPTPISMISMSSLRAALNPEPSTFLYYVLKDAKTGEHAFANTYQEHLANIEKAKQDGAL